MAFDRSMFDSLERVNALSAGTLPGLLGLQFTHIEPGLCRAELMLRPDHLAPNGYLHAAVVVALADTVCGYGCMASLPDGAVGFTTIELKTNFFATALEGVIRAEATLRHGGKRTQVWDAEVHPVGGKQLATFRCTEMVLMPRPPA